MKGISAIMSMILILVIVISIMGLVWGWSSFYFGGLTESAEETLDTNQNEIGTSFRIILARNVTQSIVHVILRNTGTTDIDLNTMGVFVDDTKFDITDPSVQTMQRGTTAFFNITGVSEPFGKRLRVSASNGLNQEATIT